MARPTKMTKAMVEKLEFAFCHGMSDREACLYAGIHKQTLYDYCNKHPEFSDRKETLKKQPSMKAKFNLVKSIEAGDLDNSKWWLERKSRDEFSTKQATELSGLNGEPVKPVINLTLNK